MIMTTETLISTQLFSGILPVDIKHLLSCLGAHTIQYCEKTTIVEEGSIVQHFGILLTGSGRSYKTDLEGRTITITLLHKGSEIGVILAASPAYKSPVSVEVQKDSSILFISYDQMVNSCTRNCPCHKRLLQNFMSIIAEKGLILHERINCLLKPSVREKIMAYLSRLALDSPHEAFTIPLDRKAMAEYLNVDRSALSRELSRMKKEGILDFHKSTFRYFL